MLLRKNEYYLVLKCLREKINENGIQINGNMLIVNWLCVGLTRPHTHGRREANGNDMLCNCNGIGVAIE